MKKFISKSLILSSVLVCSSLIAASEETVQTNEILFGGGDNCNPFPSCAQERRKLEVENQAKPSEWSKFWEELIKETMKKVPKSSQQSQ